MIRLATVLVVSTLAILAAPPAQAQDAGGAPTARRGGTRLALQGRIDAFNMFGVSDALVFGIDRDLDFGALAAGSAFAPIVSGGLRMDRLFVGAGLGLTGGSVSECENDGCSAESSVSNTGWSITPMAFYDVLNDGAGALALGGWLNVGNVGGGTFEDEDGRTVSEDGFFSWGLTLAAQIRGMLSEGLALGAEFGWGFLSWSEGDNDGDASIFIHGLFGTLLLEGSVGL